MTLGANGFLGIGVNASSPAYPIDISTGANSAQIAFQSTIADGTNFKIAQGIQGVTNSGMQIYDLSSSKIRFAITYDGFVGINNGNPITNLDVVNSSASGTGAVTTVRLNHAGTTVGDGPRLLFTSGTSTTGGSQAHQITSTQQVELV